MLIEELFINIRRVWGEVCLREGLSSVRCDVCLYWKIVGDIKEVVRKNILKYIVEVFLRYIFWRYM